MAAINFAELELCTPIYMKPTSQISRQPGRHDEERSSSLSNSNHPTTDCHFHASASEGQSTGRSGHVTRPVFAPGFRDLSNEFLGAETKRNYVAEAMFFAIIVGVSTWPIVSMVRALAEFVK
jgi:hypothetical protein